MLRRSKCQSSFCSVLPPSITPFMSGFSWELHRLLWILDVVILLAIIFISRFRVVATGVPTSESWCVKSILLATSLLGSKWTIFSFLACWLSNHYIRIDRATLSLFLVHSSIFELGLIPCSSDHVVLPWKARLFSSLETYRWFMMFLISSWKYYQVVTWPLCWVRDQVGLFL